MSYASAVASGLSKREVFEVAESFATQLGHRASDDLYAFVNRIGGRVQVEDTLLKDPEMSGSLFVDAPDDFRIIVPTHTSATRDRFTIAHELGHYVVHYLWNRSMVGRPMMALRRGSDRIEWEANWFAAAFLMPAEEFKQAFARYNRNVAATAAAFNVSSQAAEVRAKDLGLLV